MICTHDALWPHSPDWEARDGSERQRGWGWVVVLCLGDEKAVNGAQILGPGHAVPELGGLGAADWGYSSTGEASHICFCSGQ